MTVFASAQPPVPAPIPRRSIFSTSTDWESVTGLRLAIYDIDFTTDSKMVGNKGIELYYLDGFPCYGQTDRTNAWFGPKGASRGAVSIVCLYPPKEINFAYRTAARDAHQDTTTGILTCPVKHIDKLALDMSKCVTGKDWKELR